MNEEIRDTIRNRVRLLKHRPQSEYGTVNSNHRSMREQILYVYSRTEGGLHNSPEMLTRLMAIIDEGRSENDLF